MHVQEHSFLSRLLWPMRPSLSQSLRPGASASQSPSSEMSGVGRRHTHQRIGTGASCGEILSPTRSWKGGSHTHSDAISSRKPSLSPPASYCLSHQVCNSLYLSLLFHLPGEKAGWFPLHLHGLVQDLTPRVENLEPQALSSLAPSTSVLHICFLSLLLPPLNSRLHRSGCLQGLGGSSGRHSLAEPSTHLCSDSQNRSCNCLQDVAPQ